MAFSESFEFGNSTFMKLESQVNHAINDDQAKPDAGLDIILESPTRNKNNKSSFLSITKNRSRFIKNAPDYQNESVRKFRRSKSDSILPKQNVHSRHAKENSTDNYSDFFRSEFSLLKDKDVPCANKEETSMIAISEIEAAFDNLEKQDKEISKAPNDVNEDDFVLEKPIFSEDLNDLLDTEEKDEVWQDSLPLSVASEVIEDKQQIDIAHDVSSFICQPFGDTELREKIIKQEIQESHKLIKQSQAEELDTERNLSLSCMSPEQLKFTQTSPRPSNQVGLVKCQQIKATNLNHPAVILSPKQSSRPVKTLTQNLEALKSIAAWNLPLSILKEYERKGVRNMFDWQVQCLSNPKVLFEHCNLVYSAPTSAGKTLVSEILLMKTVFERGKKVLLILPFISVVREKMFYLQDLLTAAGYRVEGFFGGYTPPGGFESINVAICTIEKANSIVNKLLEQGKLDDLGCVVVDEVHLISDPGRGYILELLLAKILYMSQKYALQIQIITMSATLANVQLLKSWLNAELFITDFRPVALQEMIKVGDKIYNNQLEVLRRITEPSVNINEEFPSIQNDTDHVAQLCIETLLEGCSAIVFCPSKDWCENLAIQLAGAIHFVGKSGGEWGRRLKAQLNREAIDEVKQQLKDIPTGLDTVLEKTVTFACAFHHAGLTTEERDIVEASFKSGALKIIVATSTLSSGVNLPARRVLIRSPLFGGKQMSSLTYRQMIGRAGRTGKDTLGESILICTSSNARIGKELVSADLKPISSCLDLDSSTHLKRALLEVISSGVASTKEDLDHFVRCTLLSAQAEENIKENSNPNDTIGSALEFLLEYEFVRLQTNEETNEEHYVATRLGMACLASSMPPTDGLILFAELQKSRRCFVLESELHAVYLVTPYSVCYQLQDLDWLFFLDTWEKLPPAMKKVGELVGVKESFLVRAMRGQTKLDYKLLQIHKRFYTALALQELVNETPINVVAAKYKCHRGMLQSLQQMASTFAGIVTSFCNSLQWDTLSLIVSQFKERLYFGVNRELIDLMRLPDLSHKRARALYDAGIESLVDLANADVMMLEKILYNTLSFDSKKKQEHENDFEANKRNEERNFFITGKAGLTVAEAAKLLIAEARQFVQYEIGTAGQINWSQKKAAVNDDSSVMTIDTKNLDVHLSFEEHQNNSSKIVENVLESVSITKEVVAENIESEIKKADEQNLATPQSDGLKKLHKLKSPNLMIKTVPPNPTSDQKLLQNRKSKETTAPLKSLENIEHFQHNPKTETTQHKYNKEEKENESSSLQSNHVQKRKSNENAKQNPNVTPPKMQKLTSEAKKDAVIEEDKPSTSKKAQRLLKARQLSELKKQEWNKRNCQPQEQAQLQPDDDAEIKPEKEIKPITKKTETPLNSKTSPAEKSTTPVRRYNTRRSQENKNQNFITPLKRVSISTPKDNIVKSSKHTPETSNKATSTIPRRSPRNHLISSTRIENNISQLSPIAPAVAASDIKLKLQNNQQEILLSKTTNEVNDLFCNDNDEDSFTVNTCLREALNQAETQFQKSAPNEPKPSVDDDEIPSSQKLIEPEQTGSPHSSRFLRTLRATQKLQTPKRATEPNPITTAAASTDLIPAEPSSSSTIELSDMSMESSLIKNPMLLNASHILSCSKLDTDSSSLKSLDILDLCGNQQLFKDSFKELLANKRLGFCLGIQQFTGRRKPLIGANLLLNQVAAAEMGKDELISYHFQLDDTNYLAGIAFYSPLDNIVCYMNMQEESTCKGLTAEIKLKYLRMLLRSKEHTFITFDAKDQMKILRKILKDSDEISVAVEDPKIANWLLQPDKMHNLHSLAQQFAPECSALISLCGSGRGYNSYGLDSSSAILAKVRCSIEACVTMHILKGQIENLEGIGSGQLYKFFKELEMPLQMSLCNMEHLGFPTNSDAFYKLFQQIMESMKKLEMKIYEMHGSRFNLGSSSAVAKVVGLHRKTNGRISTSKQILEKIDSPISQMIIVYRKLSVTLSKTIQPLLKSIKDERIHGQSITYTSTGRISMSEPNLQNVAKDFDVELGSDKYTISCRSAFFSNAPNRSLISSDFCQLEMRILAHLSQDPALLHVMKSEKDVFTAIAAKWNKISENSVTEQLRNGTKQICYGIVYGMGMRALADGLKCTEQEARLVSEQFHAAYPGIRAYIEKVVKFAKNNGYIETITGRRRYLEHITSEESSMRSQAERQAVNTAIQGSAADVAKSAILQMEKNIGKYQERLGISAQSVRLVLHLHDELIFEVPEDKAKKIAKVLSVTMEKCVKLNVPLKVKLKIGKSWGDLKEVKL